MKFLLEMLPRIFSNSKITGYKARSDKLHVSWKRTTWPCKNAEAAFRTETCHYRTQKRICFPMISTIWNPSVMSLLNWNCTYLLFFLRNVCEQMHWVPFYLDLFFMKSPLSLLCLGVSATGEQDVKLRERSDHWSENDRRSDGTTQTIDGKFLDMWRWAMLVKIHCGW